MSMFKAKKPWLARFKEKQRPKLLKLTEIRDAAGIIYYALSNGQVVSALTARRMGL